METFSTIARNANDSAYPQLWRGLVGAWVPAVGVTGGTVRDLSGYRNDGTLQVLTPANAWSQAIVWAILMTDTTGERVNFTEYQLEDFTTSSWVNLSTINGGGHIILGGPPGYYCPYITPTLVYYKASTSSSFSYTFPTGNWTHILSSRRGSELSVWINAQLVATLTVSGTMPISAIGNYNSNAGFSPIGYLGSQLIYDRPATAAQARQLYSLGPGSSFLARKRIYSVPGSAFQAAWATRSTTIVGVPSGA